MFPNLERNLFRFQQSVEIIQIWSQIITSLKAWNYISIIYQLQTKRKNGNFIGNNVSSSRFSWTGNKHIVIKAIIKVKYININL